DFAALSGILNSGTGGLGADRPFPRSMTSKAPRKMTAKTPRETRTGRFMVKSEQLIGDRSTLLHESRKGWKPKSSDFGYRNSNNPVQLRQLGCDDDPPRVGLRLLHLQALERGNRLVVVLLLLIQLPLRVRDGLLRVARVLLGLQDLLRKLALPVLHA